MADLRQPTSISFSGCGSYYPYVWGVAAYIQDHFELRGIKFLCASGGCPAALMLASALKVREEFKFVSEDVLGHFDNNLTGIFWKLYPVFRANTLARLVEHHRFPSLHELLHDRLFISTTRLVLKNYHQASLQSYVDSSPVSVVNERISSWSCTADLVDSMVASQFIPLILVCLQITTMWYIYLFESILI